MTRSRVFTFLFFLLVAIGAGVLSVQHVYHDLKVDESVINNTQLTREHIDRKDTSTIFYGYWDHPSGPDEGFQFLDHVNVGKGQSTLVQGIVDQGIPAIPIVGGFDSGDSRQDWRERLEDKAIQIHGIGAENIQLILLLDEPYSRGWTDQQLEWLVDEAKDIIGEKYRFAYTVKELTIRNRPERALPQNVDYIGINYYPFRSGWFELNEEEFKSELRKTIEHARKKVDSELFIVGQAFYTDEKWIEPPEESPVWYAEVVREEALSGLLWFEWRDRGNWKGTGSMPRLFEKQKEAYKLLNFQNNR